MGPAKARRTTTVSQERPYVLPGAMCQSAFFGGWEECQRSGTVTTKKYCTRDLQSLRDFFLLPGRVMATVLLAVREEGRHLSFRRQGTSTRLILAQDPFRGWSREEGGRPYVALRGLPPIPKAPPHATSKASATADRSVGLPGSSARAKMARFGRAGVKAWSSGLEGGIFRAGLGF